MRVKTEEWKGIITGLGYRRDDKEWGWVSDKLAFERNVLPEDCCDYSVL